MKIYVVPEDQIDDQEPDDWHQLCDYETFKKWQYKDSPYRLIAHLDEDRGHYEVIFTTDFHRAESALVKGNLGGGKTGEMKAKVIAKQFMEKYENGCPPPGEINIDL